MDIESAVDSVGSKKERSFLSLKKRTPPSETILVFFLSWLGVWRYSQDRIQKNSAKIKRSERAWLMGVVADRLM